MLSIWKHVGSIGPRACSRLERLGGCRWLGTGAESGDARAVTDALARELKAIVGGDRFSDSRAVRQQHGVDEGHLPCKPPDAVVWPKSTEEVSRIVGVCHRHVTPVVPFGMGTSLEGHIAALKGGVCLDLSQMNRVLEVNEEDLDCRVEAGVTRKQLNAHLRDTGLFFPVDPGADASLGGMAATRASGTTTVRYGTMRDNVQAITAVLADGTILRSGTRARKSSAGYDLVHLMVGSEGTLGVITEVALRLWGQPEHVAAATCSFASLKQAVDSVITLMQMGTPLARIELLDDQAIRAVNLYSKTDLPERATLFFEFRGSAAAVQDDTQAAEAVVADFGGEGFSWSSSQEGRDALWEARHTAYWACQQTLRPGCRGWSTDVCVPISRLASCILDTQQDFAAAGLLAPLVGHVGDGNFHLLILVNPDDTEENERAEAAVARLIRRAQAVGGTCTGEHGIGYGKLPYLQAEHGPAGLAVMHGLKTALDPLNILNPGKLGSPPSLLPRS